MNINRLSHCRKLDTLTIFRHNSDMKPIKLDREVERFERRLIDRAMKESSENMSKAARLLGIKRTTLISRMKVRAML